ncbi:hypothetical protein D3C87_1577460 [compost metagenome]
MALTDSRPLITLDSGSAGGKSFEVSEFTLPQDTTDIKTKAAKIGRIVPLRKRHLISLSSLIKESSSFGRFASKTQ